MDSANASASGGKFEVFLSFCGKDTRHGFADFLYTDLEEAGISTFRDNEELHVGEEIGAELLKAIKDSKISIPIFSKNYASSKWCLGELAQMVECQESGHKIFPIFYDVQPSDVRHQTGSYEEAFRIYKKRKHSDKKSEETVEKWKKALREVGQLKGWELQKETNGHQGKLVKIVVRKVLLELKNKYMHVTHDNLVGIDRHLEIVRGLLNVDCNGVWIVGIHGMGGIGKTTIAKLIYDQHFEKFECCCFLADVRETSQSSEGLVKLQNQLISEILRGKSLDITNVNKGINMIKEKVYGKKVLIVLDDVDENYQFDKLAGKCDWFGSGSRIIVTTRNKAVLNVLDVDKAYEVPCMEFDHSLQLFREHAFSKDFPGGEYDDLSRNITRTAAGLPLALKVIGSYLYGKRKEVWEDTFKRLKKIPNKDVQEKLRISYDALDHEQKQIFLDIACHFIGMSSINPFYMWEDCEFHPISGVDELVLRSLVQIEGNDMLRMHDQLRDLGREIVRKKNFKEPEEHSRLWLHDDALDILKRREGTKTIETLSIGIQQTESQELHFTDESDEDRNFHFTDEEFRPLPNLRFLRLDNVELTGDFKHLFSKLRWLDWYGCPENFSPTNFHLKNLVILGLSFSNMTDEWEGWSQIKEAKKLKALYLYRCNGLTRTPDFSSFATLERLDLSWCQNLVQIDPSIADLINLRVLGIQGSGITKLPDAIGNLEKLEEMDASYCSNLQGEIPSSIGRLSSLRKLRLQGTKICSLPTSICGLSSLQTLYLRGCSELTEIRGLEGLKSLVKLNISDCGKLTEIRGLEGLKSLVKLNIFHCGKLTEIRGLEGLKSLEELNGSHCGNLTEIRGLEELKSLRFLDIAGCDWIIGKLPDLPNTLMISPDSMEAKKLKALDLRCCIGLTRTPDFSSFTTLERLDLSWWRNLVLIDPSIADLINLRVLNMRCSGITKLPDAIGNLKKLEEMDVSYCHNLQGETLSSIGRLSSLRILRLSGTKICSLPTSICGLSSLQELVMSGCICIERLPDLSNLKKLERLNISFCAKLTEIRGLEELKSLRLLEIYGCDWIIGKLPDLPNTLMISPDPMREEDQRRMRQQLTVVDVAGWGNIFSLGNPSSEVGR